MASFDLEIVGFGSTVTVRETEHRAFVDIVQGDTVVSLDMNHAESVAKAYSDYIRGKLSTRQPPVWLCQKHHDMQAAE